MSLIRMLALLAAIDSIAFSALGASTTVAPDIVENAPRQLPRVIVVLDHQRDDLGEVHGAQDLTVAQRRLRLVAAQGNVERERGTVALAVALRPNAAAVHLGELLHDGHSKAQAAVAAGGRRVLLAESLENPRQELGLDALAVIPHHQAERIAMPSRRHVHGRTLR